MQISRFLFFLSLALVQSCSFVWAQKLDSNQPVTVDRNATPATKALFQNMLRGSQKAIMLGHQDDAAYGRTWYNENGRSDIYETVGDYPAVIGWELGDIELGADRSLDSVYFSNMKRQIRAVYERGGINTISWHSNNIATGKSAWDCKQDTVVRSVLGGGSKHQQFLGYLNRLADFFLALKDKNGKQIPVIFRMYHEHTGAWFWWGAKQCTPDEYNELYRMTVRYLRDVKNVHNLLYAFSTAEIIDKTHFISRYPGNDWVDMVGFDTYCRETPEQVEQYKQIMKTGLEVVTQFATRNNKIAIMAETGQEGIKVKNYYTKVLLPLIKPYKISYVLLWRNAFNIKKHYYTPYPEHPEAKDFIQFTKNTRILLNKKAAKIDFYR
jgi:hypothetical protein